MEFKEHDEFRKDLSAAINYYSDVDQELVKGFIRELRRMKNHLTTFPEAAPLTSELPIRKFLLLPEETRTNASCSGSSL